VNLCKGDPVALDLIEKARGHKPGNPTGTNQHTERGRGNHDNVMASSAAE
jgi:hypothetical protein